MKFTKKPVTIDAMQLAGSTADIHAVYQWVEANTLGSFDPDTTEIPASGVSIDPATGALLIATLEGVMTAQPGDWIIRGVQGEFYPCKPDIFEQTYEPAHEDRPGLGSHITITQSSPAEPARIIIDGTDHSMSVFQDIELVTVGAETQYAEAGLRLTFGISRLDLADQTDLPITTANIAEHNATIERLIHAWEDAGRHCQCGAPSARALTRGDYLKHSSKGCRITRTSQQEARRG